jgi:hypothetical protein
VLLHHTATRVAKVHGERMPATAELSSYIKNPHLAHTTSTSSHTINSLKLHIQSIQHPPTMSDNAVKPWTDHDLVSTSQPFILRPNLYSLHPASLSHQRRRTVRRHTRHQSTPPPSPSTQLLTDIIQGSKYPIGRNASGFKQKFNHLKKDLRPKLDAIVAGVPVDSVTSATPKKGTPKKPTAPKTSTPRKRKAADDGDDGEKATPRKRGRPKKVVEVEEEEEFVKAEVDEDDVKEESESGDMD